MKFNYSKIVRSFSGLLLGSALIVSCGNQKETNGNGEDLQESDNDTIKNTVVNVGGKLFSIPSPVQTSMLVQKSGAAFNKEVISSHKADEYKGIFFQATNLGVFGADLGYVTMYNQSADQLKYLAQARKLSDALGISNAFDTQTMTRINDNINQKDSLLVLVGVVYRASDAFLKANQRNVVSSLILTGGWIESLNFAGQVNKTNPSEELKMRIAHQKQSLKSIIELLSQFKDENVPELKDKLVELQTIYDGVKLTYVYEKPETDALNKVTIFNSRTDVSITDDQLKQITEKIKSIRDWCVAGDKV
jgi:hypothetical protein